MAETKRLFVAAPVPASLKEIFREQQHHFSREAIRFVPEDNWHLTIHFLGEVPTAQVEVIEQALQLVSATHPAFSLNLQTLEPGPKPTSPRLIWARFARHPAFTRLCAAVATQLAIRPPDQPDYIPHITLARFRKTMAKPGSLPIIPLSPRQVNLPVNSLALWQSQLKSPHPVYRILNLFPLVETGAVNL